MKENKLADLSMEFSVQVIHLCENIKGHRALVDQLERAATSVGANIREAIMPTARPTLLPNCKSH